MSPFKRLHAPSFKNRLLTLIVGLVFVAECVTVVLTLTSLNSRVLSQARQDLRAAQIVLINNLDYRSTQLQSAANVLVADFAFKEAVANGDQLTIASALQNHAARVAADLVVLYDTDGKVMASTIDRKFGESPSLARQVATDAGKGLAVVDGRAYQLVYTKLRAPQPIATVAFGFALDRKLAEQLGAVVSANIGFVASDGQARSVTAALPTSTVLGALASIHAARDTSEPVSSTLDGTGYLATATSLLANDGSIDMVMLRPLDTVSKLFADMLPILLLIGLVTLLAAVIVASLTGRAAVRPLARLVDAARKIATGNYEQRLDVTGDEEFRQLGGAFNIMQVGIREREQRIYQQMMRDELTGLASRTAFMQLLEERIQQPGPLTLVMLDLRRFRHVNASVGFGSGSRLLCELAARLQLLVGAEGICARLSADLFALCFGLSDSATRSRLGELAQDLRGGLLVDGVRLSVDVRCGMSQFHDHPNVDDFMRQASVALVEAKERNTEVVNFQSAHDLEQRRRITLVADLRHAIDAGNLTLVYQPLVQMTGRELVMLEALVRWHHPTLGDVSPAEFVPLAERALLTAPLSRWVLAAAITQLGHWNRQGLSVEVAVNLSAADMSDASLPERTVALLAEHAVPAAQLVLEVTESTIMEEPALAAEVMLKLRAAGVRFAVDDFGTGHSSLAQLHALPVDELKIDRAFVTDLERTPSNQAIVRSTIELGHILGLRVVAEGVETPEVWSTLLRMGCDLAQGYFISRPMTAARLADWMDSQSTQLSKAISVAESSGQLTSIRLRAIKQPA
jgi:diguanylate cyclase (GGDEF)-like protein